MNNSVDPIQSAEHLGKFLQKYETLPIGIIKLLIVRLPKTEQFNFCKTIVDNLEKFIDESGIRDKLAPIGNKPLNEKEAYYRLKERLDNLPEDWRPDIGRQLVQSASDYLDQHSLWQRLSPYSDWSSKAFGKDLDEFDRFFEEMHDSFVNRSTLMNELENSNGFQLIQQLLDRLPNDQKLKISLHMLNSVNSDQLSVISDNQSSKVVPTIEPNKARKISSFEPIVSSTIDKPDSYSTTNFEKKAFKPRSRWDPENLPPPTVEPLQNAEENMKTFDVDRPIKEMYYQNYSNETVQPKFDSVNQNKSASYFHQQPKSIPSAVQNNGDYKTPKKDIYDDSFDWTAPPS